MAWAVPRLVGPRRGRRRHQAWVAISVRSRSMNVGHRQVTLDLAAARVLAHRVVGHVVVADHEHVGTFSSLALRMRAPSGSSASIISARKPSARRRSASRRRSPVVVTHRQHPHLHGRQPRREGAGVVLEQHPEEPLERPEQRPVDDSGPVALRCRRRRTRGRSGRDLEVDLERRELPRAADGVAHVHVDLRGRRRRPRPRRPRTARRAASTARLRRLGLVPVLGSPTNLSGRVDSSASNSSNP